VDQSRGRGCMVRRALGTQASAHQRVLGDSSCGGRLRRTSLGRRIGSEARYARRRHIQVQQSRRHHHLGGQAECRVAPRSSVPSVQPTVHYMPLEDSWLACRRCWGLSYASRALLNYKIQSGGRGKFARMFGTSQREWAFQITCERRPRHADSRLSFTVDLSPEPARGSMKPETSRARLVRYVSRLTRRSIAPAACCGDNGPTLV
jgi:hypothetical protein